MRAADVGGVAHCRVLDATLGADVARHHAPGVQADAHAKPRSQLLLAQPRVEAGQAHGQHLAGGGERAVGVVGLDDRRSEHRHDPVAHVGHEGAPVVEDRVAHLAQVAVEHLDHTFRGQRFGERREAAQVGEHDGSLALHAAQAQPSLGAGQDLVHDVLGHEAREQVAYPFALEGDRDQLHRERPGRAEDQGSERIYERHDASLLEGDLHGRRERRCERDRQRDRGDRAKPQARQWGGEAHQHDQRQVDPRPHRAQRQAPEDRLDRAGLDFGARHLTGGGGRVDVLQRRRRGADDHDLVVEEAVRQATAVDGRERHRAEGAFRPVVVDPGGGSVEIARVHPMPVGDFGARHSERLQPPDGEADASQDAAWIGGQQRVGGSRSHFAQQRASFAAAEEPGVPVRVGLGRGHHGAPFGALERGEQRGLVAPRLRALAGRRLGACGGERAGAGLGELHVVGDRAGMVARDLFDRSGVHPAREGPLQAQFVEGRGIDLDQHDVRRGPLAAADREAGVDGAELKRSQQVGLVGDDREAGGAQRHDRQQRQP